MPELDPDTPPKPIEVPQSALGSQVATLARDFSIVLAALPALYAVLGTRDLAKIVAFIRGDDFAQPLAIIIGLAVIGWRQWNARRQHAEKVAMANRLPDSIAIVKNDPQV